MSILVASLIITCLVLAALPWTGRPAHRPARRKARIQPFSWFAMLFGAGIGIGMLTYSTGEPLAHLVNNPDIIRGLADPQSREGGASGVYVHLPALGAGGRGAPMLW